VKDSEGELKCTNMQLWRPMDYVSNAASNIYVCADVFFYVTSDFFVPTNVSLLYLKLSSTRVEELQLTTHTTVRKSIGG